MPTTRKRSATKAELDAKAAAGGGGTKLKEEDVKQLFELQRKYFASFFQKLNFDEVAALCQKMLECKGTTLMTGIGKSAYIAKKVCQTLVSTGTRAIWLAPVDALHGDIGNVSPGDIVVMFSKSGSTEELVTLVPYAKAKGGFLVAATNDPNSKLAKMCDMHVTVPVTGELTPFNDGPGAISRQAPPVTYTALQMLFGDTIAVYLMQVKGLTQNQYAMNHPAGRIGKRLVLTVKDVMKPWNDLPLVKPAQLGMDALVHMAGTSKGCGCLLVVDDDRSLLGTFSDADLRRALTDHGEKVTQMSVKELMNYNKTFPRTTTIEAMAFDAHMTMEEPKPVDYLPVISSDGKKTLEGIVTVHTLKDAGM